ncbi:hypothetical protein OAQ99_04290 [Candidatus Kapabacteria bacterium]|nr:hypothetical protein [Candidatus Kapabacteria bacterium]
MRLFFLFMLMSLSLFSKELTKLDSLFLQEDDKKERIYIFFRTSVPLIDYSGVKDLLNEASSSSEIKYEFTDEFPITPELGLDINFASDLDFISGASVFYHSTGARLAYSDFSGEATSDFVTNTFGLAGFVSKVSRFSNKYISYGLYLGYLSKTYKTKDVISLSDFSDEVSSDFNENSYFLQPNIGIGYDFGYLMCSLNINYLFDFNSSSQRGQMGQSVQVENFINFSGFRTALVFGFNSNLFKKIFK